MLFLHGIRGNRRNWIHQIDYFGQHGFKAAIEWRDSGRPIPEGDEARAEIRRLGEGG